MLEYRIGLLSDCLELLPLDDHTISCITLKTKHSQAVLSFIFFPTITWTLVLGNTVVLLSRKVLKAFVSPQTAVHWSFRRLWSCHVALNYLSLPYLNDNVIKHFLSCIRLTYRMGLSLLHNASGFCTPFSHDAAKFCNFSHTPFARRWNWWHDAPDSQ